MKDYAEKYKSEIHRVITTGFEIIGDLVKLDENNENQTIKFMIHDAYKNFVFPVLEKKLGIGSLEENDENIVKFWDGIEYATNYSFGSLERYVLDKDLKASSTLLGELRKDPFLDALHIEMKKKFG